MRYLLPVAALVLMSFSSLAAPKINIESVRVVVTEVGKEPVKVTMPYWVAKGGAAVSDKLKIGTEDIPMKEILQVIDTAPKLGNVMTLEEGAKKIVISIQ